MIKYLWYLFYNIFIIPALYILLRAGGIFNEKIRKGIKGRKRVYEELILSAGSINKNKKLIWFHSSSLGEFEQAKPIIEKLKSTADVNILITFFSPSGYENSKKYPYANLISYIPFDTKFNAERFIAVTRPSLSIIMRYDIWPNTIKVLRNKNIPVFLVDATLRKSSPRKYPFSFSFHKMLFKQLNKILTVSESDAMEFKSFGLSEKEVKAVGDTRFDRVFEKSILAKSKKLIPDKVLENKKVLVAGSTWEQDEEVLIPAFKKIIVNDDSALLIIAPHEPNLLHIEKLENELHSSCKTIRFSHLNNYKNEKVIIVDSIGILLSLYTYAHISFVGGSFKQNVHNVLEAAVYGIPVMFGPKIENSQEAKKLVESGGGIILRNKRDAYRNIRTLFVNNEIRKVKGINSYNFVKNNTGATQKILEEIKKVI